MAEIFQFYLNDLSYAKCLMSKFISIRVYSSSSSSSSSRLEAIQANNKMYILIGGYIKRPFRRIDMNLSYSSNRIKKDIIFGCYIGF